MPATSEPPTEERNELLRSLPADVYAAVAPKLESLQMQSREVLVRPNSAIDALYFPRTCVISHVVLLAREHMVEAATAGREGFVGVPVVHGVGSTNIKSLVQIEGELARLPVPSFRELQANDGILTATLLRYAQGLHEQTAQSVACNRRHSLEERCARWLLMTHDRVNGDTFVLTQEYLAAMLGVRRAGVSEAAGRLQREGLIRYSRGRLTVVNRGGLETASCECYAVIRDRYRQVLVTA